MARHGVNVVRPVPALQNGLEERRLRGEVVQQTGVGQPAPRGDVAERCAAVTRFAEHGGRRGENVLSRGGAAL